MFTVKFQKLHPDAVVPVRANETDSGFDVVAIDDGVLAEDGRYIEYDLGFCVQPPAGYYLELFPRSSISKYDLQLCNSVGIIDEGYRGPVKVRFRPVYNEAKFYKKGDKIAQLILRKREDCRFMEMGSLEDTKRGAGGFGSTGA